MLTTTASNRQTTLDGVVTSQPRVAPFSTRGLIDHLVQLVVSEDDAFYLLDKSAFRQLIHYLRPTLSTKEIPHRTKIREEILARAAQAKSKLKATLQVRHVFCLLLSKILTMLQGCRGGDIFHLRHLDF
jgi:hypothetical protein